jgi:hypothetical protein
MMTTAPRHGPDRFIADLAECGVAARFDGPAIVYTVVSATGALAGVEVETAVSASELQPWPTVVPHWLHFRDSISFAHTNTNNNDCLRGWLRHSRDIGVWDSAVSPARAWLAYVRGVLVSAEEGTM